MNIQIAFPFTSSTYVPPLYFRYRCNGVWYSWLSLPSLDILSSGALKYVLTTNLNKNSVIISDNTGKLVSSNITRTELEYLDGVTSNIQTQINNIINKIQTIQQR